MRIGIDARFLTHPQKGGFKTYSENLILALSQINNNDDYILYLDRQPEKNYLLPNSKNFSYRVLSGRLPVVGMPWREQILLPFWASRDKLDLLHSPCLSAPLYLRCP